MRELILDSLFHQCDDSGNEEQSKDGNYDTQGNLQTQLIMILFLLSLASRNQVFGSATGGCSIRYAVGGNVDDRPCHRYRF